MTDNHLPDVRGLGDNQPPLREAAALDIEERLAAYAERKKGILASAQRVVVNDNETTGRAADFIAICQTFLEHVEVERRNAKEPYDAAKATIQGKVAAFIEEILVAIATVQAQIKAFRDTERTRQQEALRKQRAEEAKLRAAADQRKRQTELDEAAKKAGELPVSSAPSVEPAPAEPVRPTDVSLPVARGDYGSKVKDKVEKTFRITDVRALPDTILNAPKVRAAMMAAIKQLARLQTEISGVEIDDAVTDSIRKGA